MKALITKLKLEMKNYCQFTNAKILNFSKLLLLTLFICSSNLIAQTSTAPLGAGTSGDPYQIATLNNLYWLTQTTAAWASGKYFIQTADIDASSTNTWASGAGFSPIGNGTTSFAGNYEGNSKKISGLYISRTGTQYIAMFGYVSAGYIRNLTLENASITVSSSGFGNGLGILAGCVTSSTLTNINLSGGSITVTGSGQEVGTIAGSFQSSSGTIEYCRSSANITNTQSSATTAFTGGLIGYRTAGTIRYCSATGNVSTNGWRVGGLIGEIDGLGATIYQCSASGNVTGGGSGTGGFVGNIYQATITDCFASGSISGSGSSFGGFFGHAQSSPIFIRCYSSGKVNPSSWAGGFGGYCESPTVTNCYWDNVASGKAAAVGTGTPSGTLTGCSTANMKLQGTYTNWDFTTVWNINSSYNSGYPILRNVTYTPDPNTWTGTVSTDWNTAGNWSKGSVPTSTDYVVIPNVSNKPIIGNGNTGSAYNITIHTGSSLTDNGTLNIYGAVTNSGTFTTSNGAVNFVGSSAQNTTGLSGNFGSITINNALGVSLSSDVTVSGTLTLTNGLLILGSYNMTLGAASVISGTPSASNMVVTNGTGELRKTFTGTGSFTFPVGDNTGTAEYSPITLNFTSGTFSSAYAGILLSNSKFSSNTSSSHYLNRYWTVNQSGISSFSCDVTAQYLPADVVGTEGNIWTGKYSSSIWTILNQADIVNHRLTGTVSGFSTFTGGENGVMPVTLSSFTSNVNERNVNLRWITSSEQNNSGFEVERAEFKSDNPEYSRIGYVQGKGTINTPTNYTFLDTKLNSGKYQYRLKQIDNNGNFEYHNLYGVVEVGLPAMFKLSQNYPNPFNPATKIDFQLPLDSKVSLKIYDITGKEIMTMINNEFKTAGFYTVNINTLNLASGIYFYRINTESFSDVKRMLLVK